MFIYLGKNNHIKNVPINKSLSDSRMHLTNTKYHYVSLISILAFSKQQNKLFKVMYWAQKVASISSSSAALFSQELGIYTSCFISIGVNIVQ